MHSTTIPLPPRPGATARRPIHPLWMRVTHWLNALAVAVLAASGWQIYNAAPFFPFRIPAGATLGGWLGGALQWHFAAMWLLAANGLVYLALNLASRRLTTKFLPVSPRGVWRDAWRRCAEGSRMPTRAATTRCSGSPTCS